MHLELYRDEAGDPRARATAPLYEALARFLESDVQGSTAVAREILEAITSVAAGEAEAWGMTGNAWTLVLSPDWAELTPEHEAEAPASLLPLDDVRAAVAAWLAFLGA